MNTFGHLHKKQFGQHFLINHQVIMDMADEIGVHKDDWVIEIGPGDGALTRVLLPQAKDYVVVEIDRDLIPLLQSQFGDQPHFSLWHQDALTVDYGQAQRPFRLVGNLPYNISTPLIFHCLAYTQWMKDMHFMLQKEVVDRLAAPVACRDYGRLSVMVQYACQVEALFDVPPEDFDPPPKVHSAIVRLVPYQQKPFVAQDEAHFACLVKAAFAQKRKMLRKTLKDWVSETQLEALDIDPTLRPEAVTVEAYVRLSNFLISSASKD